MFITSMFAGRRTCIIFKTGFQKKQHIPYTLFTVLCGLSVIRVRRLRKHVSVKIVIWKMNSFGIMNVNYPTSSARNV
jgi:hypothetical protein